MKFPHSIGKELLCSMDNNSAKLLGLKDVIVKNVELWIIIAQNFSD